MSEEITVEPDFASPPPTKKRQPGIERRQAVRHPGADPLGKHNPNNPSSPKMVNAALGEYEVLQLRREGLNLREIGAKLGVSHGTAWRRMQVSLENLWRDIGEEARHIVAVELERLDGIFRTHYELALQGDTRAADICLKVMAQRARYIKGVEHNSWPEGADGKPQAPGSTGFDLTPEKLDALSDDDLATVRSALAILKG